MTVLPLCPINLTISTDIGMARSCLRKKKHSLFYFYPLAYLYRCTERTGKGRGGGGGVGARICLRFVGHDVVF